MKKHIKLEYIQQHIDENVPYPYNNINETVIEAVPCSRELDFGKNSKTLAEFDFFTANEY